MSLTKDFDNGQWFDVIDGDGSAVTSEAGRVLTCSATGISRAYKRYFTCVMPGETVTFSACARNRSQDGIEGFARVWIDNFDGDEADFCEVLYDDPTYCTVSVTISKQANGPQRVLFGLGLYGSIQGSADFWDPILKRSGTSVVMMGTFEFPAGGGCILREDFLNLNVGAISWRGDTQSWRIEPSIPFNFSETLNDQFKPHLTFSADFAGNETEVYTWYAGSVNNVAWVQIQACTMGTLSSDVPSRVNLAADTNGTRFATFKLEMVTSE